MMSLYDAFRETRALQQAIAPGKMPVALLLGAGCPLSVRVSDCGLEAPLIPDTAGLTKHIQSELAKDDSFSNRVTQILDQLRADGKETPNIEDILSHIRALHQAAGSGEVRGLSARELTQLDDKVCELIDNRVSCRLPGLGTPYHLVASWVGAITREHAVEIFTTNYDLLMEQALEETGVPYFDGFVGSDRTFFDPASMELDRLPARWARLWKLHGSINWRQSVDSVVSRGENRQIGRQRFIHPSHLKYDESRRMPYLAMIDRLRSFLRRVPAVLITCGFSFSDQHLNDLLHQELQGNQNAICFALLFSELDHYQAAVSLAQRRANLLLLARDEAVIATRRGGWRSGPQETTATKPLECFALGDFAKLAAFLAGEIGNAQGAGEAKDAG